MKFYSVVTLRNLSRNETVQMRHLSATLLFETPLGCGLGVGVSVQLKEVKVSSYIAQYPVLRITQSVTR